MDLPIYFKLREFDITFSILGIISSVLLILFFQDNIIYIFTGFLILLPCVIWLLIRNNLTLKSEFSTSSFTFLNFNLFFFFIFVLSIISISLRPAIYERPLVYYILVLIMVVTVAVEILYCQRMQCCFVLFQILFVGISLTWSQLLIFPSLLGVDPWYHQSLTNNIINNNFIPPDYGYSKLPIFHLLIASTSLITGLNYKYSMMLSSTLIHILCNCLFIFLLGKLLLNNHKVGLLASLLLLISNYHIFMSYSPIPNSLAAVFILIIFYLLFKENYLLRFRINSLVIFLMVALILTHTITSLCMSMMLFTSWSVSLFSNYNFRKNLKNSSLYDGLSNQFRVKSNIYDYGSRVTLNFSMLFTTIMFSWWTFASGHIVWLGDLIKWGFRRDYFIHSAIKLETTIPLFERFISIVGPYSFFSLALIGFFYMISKKGTSSTFNIGFVGSVPLVAAFISTITEHGIVESRWLYFAQMFFSIFLAVSILLLSTLIEKSLTKKTFIVSLLLIFSVLMIIQPTSGVDNNIAPHISIRETLKTSEIQAIQSTTCFWNGAIKADRFFAYTQSFEYNTTSFDNELYSQNFYLLKGDLILIRNDIIYRPFLVFDSIVTLNYNLMDKLSEYGYWKIYDNGAASAFV